MNITHAPRSYESTQTCTVDGLPVVEHNTTERAACGITEMHVADALAEYVEVYGRSVSAHLVGRGIA